ncbi:hypothetical protein [Paenibacillus sp. Soil724D2]|uniref:hypothetical protein n=1 Tax=Paenibacillus sp. (strain Soil724D2) TaxID=1736392 RepID=UPI00071513BC|nr:hypothetical protein [Paenibacillus sp. Soil724D2]KRE47963.1 hypothetical protein ASG85_26560 [Paenibacillus sp. Soil724D2]
MGLGDYQLILYPAGNMPELTDMGMDFVGPFNFDFNDAVQILKSVDCLRNYSPQAKWPSFDDACYYLYDNGKSKVEIELNAGTVAEKAEIISLRTNIYKDEGSIVDAFEICKLLSKNLNLHCWDVKLKYLIRFDTDIEDKSVNHFYALRNRV